MNFNQIKRSLTLPLLSLLVAATVTSCTIDDAVDFNTVELGAIQKEYVVSREAGWVDIAVFSNVKYEITVLGDDTWARPQVSYNSGDSEFTVDYDANESFPRMARIVLNSGDHRQDTILLKQHGEKTPVLSFPSAHMTVSGSNGGVRSAALDTNIDFADLTVETRYTSDDAGNWLSEINYADGKLNFTATANPNQTEPRSAHLLLSFVDGMDKEFAADLYITQGNARDEFGTVKSFEEIRQMCAPGQMVQLNSSYLIDAWVVSDNAGGNMGFNPQTTESTIDYTGYLKTAYLESLDGKYGFMVVTATENENTFERYQKVRVSLKGAFLNCDASPLRYTISGFMNNMILSSEKGMADMIPSKEKYIGDLTDDDLYTYVTLRDCELPIRKGPLTPINEGYANATGANRTDKFASLARDVKGSSIYLYTNTTCLYRRDGSRLPYGSGTISGIVVNELMPRFEYEDNDSGDDETYGNIGKYQLRHVSKSDFKLEENFNNSFSALLTEYRFIQYDNNKLKPTYGTNGYLTHSYKDGSGAIKIVSNEDFSYLGPVGNNDNYFFGKNIGNLNGLGIILEDGTDWYANNPNVNNNTSSDSAGGGKGKCPPNGNTEGPAWVNWYWWDKTKNRGHAWILNVSTAGIVTDQLSMQISVLNDRNSSANGYSGPRYFKVEWSETGNMDNNSDWSYIGSYTVPDIGQWSPATRYWQCPGFKPINFQLPLTMLGKENVYIRMQVTKNVAGDLESYAGTTISSPSCMNYLAIRYNK